MCECGREQFYDYKLRFGATNMTRRIFSALFLNEILRPEMSSCVYWMCNLYEYDGRTKRTSVQTLVCVYELQKENNPSNEYKKKNPTEEQQPRVVCIFL